MLVSAGIASREVGPSDGWGGFFFFFNLALLRVIFVPKAEEFPVLLTCALYRMAHRLFGSVARMNGMRMLLALVQNVGHDARLTCYISFRIRCV